MVGAFGGALYHRIRTLTISRRHNPLRTEAEKALVGNFSGLRAVVVAVTAGVAIRVV